MLDEGTGIVHIAPGCGAEDFEIGRREELPVLVPVDEAGLFVEGYGELIGHSAHEVPDLVVEHLERGGWLLRQEPHEHRYPHCWRCGTKLIFRVVDEWFIRCDEIRQPMIDANRTVEWTPAHFGKRMEDWLRNMGDWCISRKRYWGLPLPFWFCPDGHMNVIASQEELRERATAGLEGLHELHRPWIDPVTIACAECGAEAERVPEVGDCWLDAGIVPFSTLGYGRDAYEPEGFAAGAGVGLTKADLPDHAYWEKWFPADWVSEMREQIRLWFYSQLFMSVALVGRGPVPSACSATRSCTTSTAARCTSRGATRSGSTTRSRRSAPTSAAGCSPARTPAQNMNFGYGPANDVARRLLTLWNTYRFLVLNANPEGFRPLWAEADRGPAERQPARSLGDRARQRARARLPRRARRLRHAEHDAGRRGVLGRPLELVRAPLAPALLGGRPHRVRHAAPRARAVPARSWAR